MRSIPPRLLESPYAGWPARALRRLVAVLLLVAVAPMAARGAPEVMVPLPSPTADHVVGTTVAYLTDSLRRDSSFADGRPITVQLWYPAESGDSLRPKAPYLVERGLGRALIDNQYYGIDTTSLGSWSELRTHAILDARIAGEHQPLVAFSVGLGVVRANYTSLAEDLASHGYVVALVESPFAGLMVLPNGRVVLDTTAAMESAAFHRARVAEWARDVRFVVERIFYGPMPGFAGEVAAHVVRKRYVTAGHSSGGLVAMEACANDLRCVACADLDGGLVTPEGEPLSDTVPKGVDKPLLILRSKPVYSDADLAKRGLTREQWLARSGKGGGAFDSLVARSRATVTIARIAGTGHFSFSDAPFVMPSTITRFGGQIIDAARGRLVIATALREYFNQALMGQRSRSLEEVARRFEELSVEPGIQPVRPDTKRR